MAFVTAVANAGTARFCNHSHSVSSSLSSARSSFTFTSGNAYPELRRKCRRLLHSTPSSVRSAVVKCAAGSSTTPTSAASSDSNGHGNEKGAAGMTDADRKQHLLDVLSEIRDPDLHQDIVTLGFIKRLQFTEVAGLAGMYDVSFDVELTTPACPVKDVFQADAKRLAEAVPWIGKADVNMTALPPGTYASPNGSGGSSPDGGGNVFEYVNSVIAVASCKGGVGKSTTAVNLAYSLSKRGARVGILDADIYGPSLPTLVHPDDRAVQFRDGRIQPLERDGVKLMSFGYINPEATAVMRGPMIASVFNQIATTTKWGVLDYLVIDLPPGTGDIQLNLAQLLRVDAAVIVTTPQRLAFVDVVKGIDMFDKVNVPSVAVVENMSWFTAPDTGKVYKLFGQGHGQRLTEQFGFANCFDMPISPTLCESSDSGNPHVLTMPDSDVAQEYAKLADCVVREVAKLRHGSKQLPDVAFDETTRMITVTTTAATTNISNNGNENKKVQLIQPAELRKQCKCAQCVDEMTGKVILDVDSVPDSIQPRSIRTVGNYAVEIIWSDNHPSLYPYSRFVDGWEDTSAERAKAKESAGVGV